MPHFPSQTPWPLPGAPGSVWNVLGEVGGVSWRKLLSAPEHSVPEEEEEALQFPALQPG